MIPETPTLQRKISQGEERYTNLIKNEFIKHAKEINRLHKRLDQEIRSTDADLSGYYTKDETEQKIIDFLEEQPVVSLGRYPSVYNFPNIGVEGALYVDISDNSIYRWDRSNNRYFCVGRDWTEIRVIEGGSANG